MALASWGKARQSGQTAAVEYIVHFDNDIDEDGLIRWSARLGRQTKTSLEPSAFTAPVHLGGGG